MSREEIEDRLNRLMRDLSTETILMHQAIADRLGLNVTDHKALGFLLDVGEAQTPGQLAVLMRLTTGAITGIVDRLAAAGLVRRKRDPVDRRRVIIALNLDRVRRQVFPVFDELAKRMSAVAASYSQRDLATITDFMQRGVELSREYRAKIQASRPALRR